MSKFCGNCGTELQDGAVFCASCGQSVSETPVAPVAPVASATPVAPVVPENTPANAPKDKKKFLIPAIIAAVVAVIVVVLIFVFTGGSEPEDAVENYIDAYYNGDYDAYVDIYPDEIWEYREKEYDSPMMDEDEYEEEYKEDMLVELEEEVGKNPRVSYEIIDKEELDEDELDEIRDNLNESYNLDKDDITAAYELEVKLTLKGDDGEDIQEGTLTVYEYDGDWYVQR